MIKRAILKVSLAACKKILFHPNIEKKKSRKIYSQFVGFSLHGTSSNVAIGRHTEFRYIFAQRYSFRKDEDHEFLSFFLLVFIINLVMLPHLLNGAHLR